jgi:phenylacetate-coenzyme A ligase PaaK-like adenylate-forming protein
MTLAATAAAPQVPPHAMRTVDIPRRPQVEDLRPATLARAFGPVLRAAGTLAQVHDELADRLIDLTVRTAREEIAYYRCLIPASEVAWDRRSLRSLPTIDRSTVVEQREALVSGCTDFAFASFTSGTTGAPPLMIERSTQETEWLAQFFAALLPDRVGAPAPLGLELGSLFHGTTLRPPRRGYNFIVDLRTRSGFHRAVWLLQQSFRLPQLQPHISFVKGPLQALQQLGSFLAENGLASAAPLSYVSAYAEYLAPPARAAMAASFGCKVLDTYSLAEIFGGARYCPHCAAYHFDPFCAVEFVDPESNAEVDEGCCEIVLTPLLPFTRRFLMLRYRTGDLAFVRPVDCAAGPRAVTFRGRLSNAQRFGSDWVGAADIIDALHPIDDVHRPVLIEPPVTLGNRRVHAPRFNCRRQDGACLIEIEVCFDPASEPDRARAVHDRIREQLLATVRSSLRDRFAMPGALSITTCRPGGLGEPGAWKQ